MQASTTSILIALLLCSLSVQLTAQATYSKRYHFNLNSVFFTSIEPVSDSTYLVLGVVTDTIPPFWGATLSTLFDEQGNVLEQHIVRDPQRNVEAWTKDHRAGDRIYKTGYVHGNGIGALLMAFDLDGEPLWEVQQEGYYDTTTFFRFDEVLELNDKLYVAGYNNYTDNGRFYEVLLSEYSREGQLLDFHSYSIPDWRHQAHTLKYRADGLLLIGGVIDNKNRTDNNFEKYNKLWAVDTLGQLQWTWQSAPGEVQGGIRDMVLTPDGGFVIATKIGTEFYVHPTAGELRYQPCVYKLNADMEEEWRVYFRYWEPSTANALERVISLSDNSGYLAIGRVLEGFPENDPDTENVSDVGGLIGKISPAGDSLWSRLIIHPGLPGFREDNHAYDITETPDGGFLLAGKSSFSVDSVASQQGWLLKIDEWGCLVPGCHLVNSVETTPPIALNLLLYPNPVQDHLYAYLGPGHIPAGSKFSVYDTNGQLLRQQAARFSDATYTMELNALPAGLYVLQLQAPDGQTLATKQFVKGL